jgi:hypothetical protein
MGRLDFRPNACERQLCVAGEYPSTGNATAIDGKDALHGSSFRSAQVQSRLVHKHANRTAARIIGLGGVSLGSRGRLTRSTSQVVCCDER